jgi:hypothetical protein
MHRWNLHDFAIDLLENKLSLMNPMQEEDILVYEDWILMRMLKSSIYRQVHKDYMVGGMVRLN